MRNKYRFINLEISKCPPMVVTSKTEAQFLVQVCHSSIAFQYTSPKNVKIYKNPPAPQVQNTLAFGHGVDKCPTPRGAHYSLLVALKKL